jgi:hypothetical protein
MSSGSGSTSGGTDDDTGDDSDDDDDDSIQNRNNDPEKRRLIAENKRRRQLPRQYRQRAEAAEAKLAENGTGNSGNSPDSLKSAIKLAAAISKSGLKEDRIDAALRLIDPDLLDEPEDALADLREAHPFLFDSSDDDDKEKTGPTSPKLNNGRKRLNQESDQQRKQRLAQRFPALRGRL